MLSFLVNVSGFQPITLVPWQQCRALCPLQPARAALHQVVQMGPIRTAVGIQLGSSPQEASPWTKAPAVVQIWA